MIQRIFETKYVEWAGATRPQRRLPSGQAAQPRPDLSSPSPAFCPPFLLRPMPSPVAHQNQLPSSQRNSKEVFVSPKTRPRTWWLVAADQSLELAKTPFHPANA